MGQYYRVFMCEDNGSAPSVLSALSYRNGSKLMEHSYYCNNFVGVVCTQLQNRQMRVWWVGDYACEEDIPEDKKKYSPIGAAWEDDDLIAASLSDSFDFEDSPYLINLTTSEYVDLRIVYRLNEYGGSCIHPLPLLTAVGNGRGGGDYHSDSAKDLGMVGFWAGDLLQIAKQAPKDDSVDYIDISEDIHFRED